MKNLLLCAVIIMSLAVIGCGGDDSGSSSSNNKGGIYAPHLQTLGVAKELGAKGVLKAIHVAQAAFSADNGKYATSFSELAQSHLNEAAFKSPDSENKVKLNGYVFEQDGDWNSAVFEVKCYPEDASSKDAKFKMDSNGTISEYK